MEAAKSARDGHAKSSFADDVAIGVTSTMMIIAFRCEAPAPAADVAVQVLQPKWLPMLVTQIAGEIRPNVLLYH